MLEKFKKEFLNLLKEAKMSKAKFAEELGYTLKTIEKWCDEEKIPRHIYNILLLAIKARKYEDYLNSKI